MTDKISAALNYADRGWHVFPCKPQLKVPLTANGHHAATTDQEQIEKWWTVVPDANIGLSLKASGLIAVDVDLYKEDCAWDSFLGGRTFDPACIQRSARGGFHYIFTAPEDEQFLGSPCVGVDVKHDGYILLAPSEFEGNLYAWDTDDDPAPVPDWLPRRGSAVTKTTLPEVPVGELERLVLSGKNFHVPLRDLAFKNACAFMPAGQNVAYLRSLMQRVVLQDQRWQDRYDQIPKLVSSAEQKIKAGLPAIVQETGVEHFVSDLKSGQIKPTVSNIYEVLIKHPSWQGVFAFNEFANRKMVSRKPPYLTGDPRHFRPRDLTDNDYTMTNIWIDKHWGRCGRTAVIDAVNAASQTGIISPVRHYLETLPAQADQELLSGAFERYFGVIPRDEAERDYVRAVSRMFFTQAVARAIEPGCKADSVVVLEGSQGVGKSSAIRALCGSDWFGDSCPPFASKDASDYLRGKWIIELSEMAFQQKAAVEIQKSFLSRQEERYRPAYGREEVTFLRRCVFIATTNRDDWAIDDTGNRRFLPIRSTQIDLLAIKRDRDRLWSAAYQNYLRSKRWWLTDEEAAYAEEQTEERRESDPWVEEIRARLVNHTEVSIKEAFEVCFPDDVPGQSGQGLKSITKQMARRMSGCLQDAGFKKAGKFTGGPRRNQVRFVRPDPASN